MILLILLYWLTVIQAQNADKAGLWDTYTLCQSSLGKPSWICDPHRKLKSHEANERLDDLLWHLQTDVPCYCADPNDCYRYENISIQSGVVAMLLVTVDLPTDVDSVSGRIYENARLAASDSCDNGLLIVYGMDTQKLYVRRGASTSKILLAEDENDLLDRVKDRLRWEDYKYPLPALLEQYISKLQGQTYERQGGWQSIIGIVVGVSIAAFVCAVILGICLARYCAKKKSLSRPPASPYSKRQDSKMKSALRRVQRKRTKAVIRHKKTAEKTRTMTGRPISPKRLASAKRRLFRKQARKQRQTLEEKQQQQQRALLTPSSGSEEQYYLISEPGSNYAPYGTQATLRMGADSHTGTLRPPSAAGYQPPAILYPNSQAVFNHPPSPRRETQRRDFYIHDEEGKEIYDTPER